MATFKSTNGVNTVSRSSLSGHVTPLSVAVRAAAVFNRLDERNQGRNVLAMGVGELLREIENMDRSIEDLHLPSGLGEYDKAAFTDLHARLLLSASVRRRC